MGIFQSTLPRGERQPSRRSSCRGRYFNPRSHEGSDVLGRTCIRKCPISIHAPTRGATRLELAAMQLEFISIHAPTRGATSSVTSNSSPITFQSTLPRGERPSSGIWLSSPFHFNPRSHEGSDLPECAGGTDQVSISIHAPTRGATILLCLFLLLIHISIHAPTRGATTFPGP